jgi:flavin-dependent dehydrogenase
VLYSRFDGGLTAGTGAAYAKRLGTLVAQAASVAFFCDLSRLTHYDLLARSSFARIVLAHRRKFKSLTILTWAQGMSAAMEGLVETLGGPIEVLTNHDEFDARLLKVAPFVRNKLDSIPYFAPGT